MKHLHPSGTHRQLRSGFSLVELMIAITLGLLIMTGLTSIFVKNSQARSEIERANRQIESGRYAMALLSDDLRMAGYLAAFNPYESIISPSPPAPPLSPDTAVTPTVPAITDMASVDPCFTNPSDLNNTFFFHVQGYDKPTTPPSCVSDARAGSDILVIRRVSTCVAGPTLETGCDAVASGTPYFQSSNCYQATELAANSGGALSMTDYRFHFRLQTDTSLLDRHAINCTTIADYRRYLTHIYFVANNNVGSDGIPTLKRAELGASGFTIVPLVEGIETMQFEYGIDLSAPSDPTPRTVYSADPNLYNSCTGATCVMYWLHTYSVKVNVLARNIEKSTGYTDNKTYTLGLKADGSPNVFPATGTYGDAYKRHAYTATVRLDNPSGRRWP